MRTRDTSLQELRDALTKREHELNESQAAIDDGAQSVVDLETELERVKGHYKTKIATMLATHESELIKERELGSQN